MKIIKELRWALIAFASLIIFFGVCFLLVPTNKNELPKKSRESRATTNPNAIAVVNQYAILPEGNKKATNIPEGNRKKFEHKPSEVKKEQSPVGALLDSPGPGPVPGLDISEEELKTLHEQQEQEIRRRAMDMDEIVVPPSKERPSGMTRGELMVLHEQQEREIQMRAMDPNEIIAPPTKDRPSGMTRRELQALHEQQEREIQMRATDMDEM